MTGAYFRVKRDGRWENIELEHLTRDERYECLSGKKNAFLISCIDILSERMVQAEKILDDLVNEGILAKA